MNYSLSQLIYHKSPMLLLDEIVDKDGEFNAIVKHQYPSIFSQGDGSVPNWIAIEYMAQAISAYSGVRHLDNNEDIEYGLLLSVRNYHSSVVSFKLSQKIFINVNEIFKNENGIATFDCIIKNEDDDTIIVKAQITAAEVKTKENIQQLI